VRTEFVVNLSPSNSMNYDRLQCRRQTVERKLSSHMANYAACDESWVVESDETEEERHTTTKMSAWRDFASTWLCLERQPYQEQLSPRRRLPGSSAW